LDAKEDGRMMRHGAIVHLGGVGSSRAVSRNLGPLCEIYNGPLKLGYVGDKKTIGDRVFYLSVFKKSAEQLTTTDFVNIAIY
jgi:hypothetical protein